VDAPLDDHNVERFCNLLNAMLARTETRFLIITHHPLTMARMNRLFGVTMMERGVSQLVSVNLEEATELVQEAG
jgi:chromosome segregation protein